ncbi:kinase-like domain-containing protein [Sparassis latifolia]
MLGYDPANMVDSFYTPPYYAQQPLNYHLYTQARSEVLAHKYFISDSIREELQRRSETIRTALVPDMMLPEEMQGYHSLVPLEPSTGDRRKFGNWYSSVYRATNSADGLQYVLRRIENFRLMQQTAFTAIENWSRLRHPNIVSVQEAFTTRAFTDSSLVVVYDYHPNAQTVYEAHIKPKAPQFQNGRLQTQSNRIPEQTMWSYVIQIANAIKAVHDSGMAVRIIDPTKILLTGKNRVRIGSCGVVDVLMYESHADIAFLQQEDLAMFGKLIISLCCNNPAPMNNLVKSMETVGRHYSSDLKSVALFLISKPGPHKIIGQLFDMIGSRLLTEMDEMQNAVDRLEGELLTELENARLVRLLCKFGFINERPEFAREPRWSETGDRYIVKLFRDYVFHQVDEQGNPVVNLSHVLTCLNKLDAGTDERIMLVSRDEQSCLVVSYKEVKSCINSAFRFAVS